MSDLTLQGAADGNSSTLTGAISVIDSLNITLRNFIFSGIIQVSDSSNVNIVGTEGDDEINVELEGTIENVNVEGDAGSDDITINTDADIGLGQLKGQVNLSKSLEVVTVNISGDGNEVQVEEKIDIPGSQVTINNPKGDVIINSSGAIDVSDDEETGGKIEINAKRIAIFGSLSADGGGDGGVIHLLANDMLVIGNDGKLTANASLHGDGGEILAIAEDHAAIASSAILGAKGGSQSGDGGFIETSGYQSFDIGAIPDVSANNGQAGEWLLDPANDIEVISGGTNTNINESSGNFTTTDDSAKIGVNNIVTALGSGDVTITTGTAGTPPAPSQSGNVSWKADMTYTGSTERTLTVNAIGNIVTNNKIEATGGKLNIKLNADSDQDGTGYVDIQANLISNGGDITIIGTDVNFNAYVQTSGGDLTLSPSKNDALVGFGTGAGGGFYIAEIEFAWLLLPNPDEPEPKG